MKRSSFLRFLSIFIGCILFLSACIDSSEQKFFPQEYPLTSKRFDLGRPIHPFDIELKNGFLIFCAYPVMIYSATDYSLRYVYERRTEPDAIQLPQNIRSSSPYFYVLDVNNKNEIRKYLIDSLGQPFLMERGFAGTTIAMNRPYLRDSLIVYDEFIPEASLKIHNLYTNAEVMSMTYGTTDLDSRFFDKNMGGLYANDSCMAFAYKYQDRIDFYDWQFTLKKSINHQRSEPVIVPKIHMPGTPSDNVVYYHTSYMGRNYFYTLYRGISQRVFESEKVLVNKEFNVSISSPTCDVLEVYALNGEPVCRFQFTDMAPSMFVVDEENNRILGYREGLTDLLVYPLQGLPKNGKLYPIAITTSQISLPSTKEPEAYKEVMNFKGVMGGGGLLNYYICVDVGKFEAYFEAIDMKNIPVTPE